MMVAHYLRDLRIVHNERLLDQSERLGMRCSQISRIETGKDPEPQSFQDFVLIAYGIDEMPPPQKQSKAAAALAQKFLKAVREGR